MVNDLFKTRYSFRFVTCFLSHIKLEQNKKSSKDDCSYKHDFSLSGINMTRNFWICLFNKSQLLLNSSFLISVWEKEQFVRKKINKSILVFQLIQHYKISLLRLLWRKIINENEDIEQFLVKNNLNNWKKRLVEHIIRM